MRIGRPPVPASPIALLALVGCGYSWEVDPWLVDECAYELDFYLDEDGDGWGAGEGEAACEAPDQGYVTNGLDCDDDMPSVTGAGDACPAALTPDDATYVGARYGSLEFLAIGGGATPFQSALEADSACASWGGSYDGALATFGEAAAYDAVRVALGSLGDDPVALFVGLRWEGTWTEGHVVGGEWVPGSWDGAWVWTDGSSSLIGNQMPWCGGSAPTPNDLAPGYHPEDLPDQTEVLDALRLALVHAGGAWCLGSPLEAGDEGPYLPQEAHVLCARSAIPVPADPRTVDDAPPAD